ncbi:MAG: OmpH family outer membrane protein [Muribaculaceae bacterium]|nr:OmpH family outer membrane protein [Muribaculaceae bacterium]MBP3537155.1 OmpH family outer membrane protein [Muribaculaceae bacterium]
MFKKIFLALALILPLSGMAQKFGIVDIDQVFQAMPETAAMQKQLEETSKKYETEFQKLQEEVNKLYTDYQTIQNDAATPESIKERRIQEIQERAQKVDQFRATAQQDIQRLQETLATPIQAKLTEAVKAVGAEGNYTFIFPNEQGLLLYTGADVTNITADVRKKLGI